ncbi:hypothetical protein YUMDRAFT_05235 [Streptomyces sp. OspMP-M45]|nr:hypothetical protein YUMDRAFT_05235 [Streptomyces sp. OspMP-M45]
MRFGRRYAGTRTGCDGVRGSGGGTPGTRTDGEGGAPLGPDRTEGTSGGRQPPVPYERSAHRSSSPERASSATELGASVSVPVPDAVGESPAV